MNIRYIKLINTMKFIITPLICGRMKPSDSAALFIHCPVFDSSSCFLRHKIHTQITYKMKIKNFNTIERRQTVYMIDKDIKGAFSFIKLFNLHILDLLCKIPAILTFISQLKAMSHNLSCPSRLYEQCKKIYHKNQLMCQFLRRRKVRWLNLNFHFEEFLVSRQNIKIKDNKDFGYKLIVTKQGFIVKLVRSCL